MKVIINSGYGKFEVSNKAKERYFQLNQIPVFFYHQCDKEGKLYCKVTSNNRAPNIYYTFTDYGDITDRIKFNYIDWSSIRMRTDSTFIQVVEELGEQVNSPPSYLKIIEIPNEIEFEIERVDGREWILEKRRRWG